MKKYIIIISALSTLAVASCKKTYLDQEVNPNAPSTTTPQFTLSSAENTASAITTDDYVEYGVWAGYWTNSGNYTPSTELQEFSFSSTDLPGGDCWDDLYSNLSNINLLQTSTAGNASLADFTAIAMILKVYDFQQLVDNFEDVPYTQAFQPSTILFPQYDKGPAIYADLVKQLDAAIALIQKNPGAASPGSSDIIYDGNMVNWAKFANTMKLKLAIRQSNLSTNTAQAALASTASIGYIDSLSEADAQPGYQNVAGKESPFYGNYGFDATGNTTALYLEFRANQVDTGIMHVLSDPRGPYYYGYVPDPNNASALIIRGNQLGNKNNLSNTYTSPFGPGLLKSPSQPNPVFSSYESYFLQAEAVARGWITSTHSAAELYNSGIRASFTAVGCPGVDAYLTQGGTVYPTGSLDAQVQAIITQKYISLNGYFNNEAYAEYRRTGYPALPQNPASADIAAKSPTLPVRLPYPSSELTNNGAVLKKEGAINYFTDRVFWDTKIKN